MPTEELEDLFYSGFEEPEDVAIFLDQVFDFRLENHMEEGADRGTGFISLPDMFECNEYEINLA